MKRKTPKGIWALRGVTAAITLVVIIVVATVAYSAYEDYNYLRTGLAQGNQFIAGKATYDQTTGVEKVAFNVTVSNRGMYSLNVTISCSSANPQVNCQTGTADVSPGQTQVVHFALTVTNPQQFLSSPDHRINGTVAMALEPFASLSVGVNFTSFVQVPGGP